MESKEEFEQDQRGAMAHPGRGFRRLFFRGPLYLWRMGLGRLLGDRFLVLTTRGRKSGLSRHTMLEVVFYEGRPYVGAGWGTSSAWVRNLLADPQVLVQHAGLTWHGIARRVVDGDLMRAIYPEMKKSPIWDAYTASWGIDGKSADDVADKADRLWTFTFDRDDVPPQDALQPMKTDLVWVWGVVAGAVALSWLA